MVFTKGPFPYLGGGDSHAITPKLTVKVSYQTLTVNAIEESEFHNRYAVRLRPTLKYFILTILYRCLTM